MREEQNHTRNKKTIQTEKENDSNLNAYGFYCICNCTYIYNCNNNDNMDTRMKNRPDTIQYISVMYI